MPVEIVSLYEDELEGVAGLDSTCECDSCDYCDTCDVSTCDAGMCDREG